LAERHVRNQPREGASRGQQGDALIKRTKGESVMPHVIVKLYAGKSEAGGDVKLSTLQRYCAAIGERFAVAV
jgi:hypothetical protein